MVIGGKSMVRFYGTVRRVAKEEERSAATKSATVVRHSFVIPTGAAAFAAK
jgi:hypothetical protein